MIEKSVLTHCCKKWDECTKKHTDPWPKTGTFSQKLLIQIEAKVRDYKINNKINSCERKEQKRWRLRLKAFMKIAHERRRLKK